MRQAGEVIRTDIGMHMDGRPKGTGTVVFVDPEGAKAAIGVYIQPEVLLQFTSRNVPRIRLVWKRP